MAVAVAPHDCLKNPLSKQPLISPHLKNPRNPNPNLNRANRRKRSPPRPNDTSPPSRTMVVPKVPAKNLVMGQVKILKRGEELTETAPDPKKFENPPLVKKKMENPLVKKIEKPEISDLGSTERLGPDPKSVPTKIRLTDLNGIATFYAGSACITSPPPSSLPLPAFFKKKCVSVNKDKDNNNNNDDATSNLIRMLRLDLQP